MRVALATVPRASETALLAYDAAAQPKLWQAFVDAVSADHAGAAVSLLLGVNHQTQACVAHQSGLDADFAARWWLELDHAAGDGNAVRAGDGNAVRAGDGNAVRAGDGDEVCADTASIGFSEALRRAPDGNHFYRDHMKAERLAPVPPLVIDLSTGTALAGLAIFQRVGGRPLDEVDVMAARILAPHLARALRIRERIQTETRHQRCLSELLDRQQTGLLLLDRSGRCVHANAGARRVAALEDGLCFRDGRLHFPDRNTHNQFAEAVALAVAVASESTASDSPRALSVARPSGLAPFGLTIASIGRGHAACSSASVAVHVNDPTSRLDARVLRAQYDLTRSEAALGALLAAGHSLAESAERRGIGIGTARGYLKDLCRKTGTHGQREVVQLLLTGVAPIASSRPRSVPAIPS